MATAPARSPEPGAPARVAAGPVQLSAYVLTFNSERHLDRVLAQLVRVADEIVVADSGSSDGTIAIAERHRCRIERRPFTTFPEQRNWAASICRHDHVLFLDSDEIMDEDLVAHVLELKRDGLAHFGYWVKRDWIVLGGSVHALYPVRIPDRVPRLIDRRRASFLPLPPVHEKIDLAGTRGVLRGRLLHITFETAEVLERKLEQYSSLAATELARKSWGVPSLLKVRGLSRAPFAFLRWYFKKGGWRDGRIGVYLSLYAARYTARKYARAAELVRARRPAATAAKPVQNA